MGSCARGAIWIRTSIESYFPDLHTIQYIFSAFPRKAFCRIKISPSFTFGVPLLAFFLTIATTLRGHPPLSCKIHVPKLFNFAINQSVYSTVSCNYTILLSEKPTIFAISTIHLNTSKLQKTSKSTVFCILLYNIFNFFHFF